MGGLFSKYMFGGWAVGGMLISLKSQQSVDIIQSQESVQSVDYLVELLAVKHSLTLPACEWVREKIDFSHEGLNASTTS